MAVLALPQDLPAEDRERSPITGFVRAHWEAIADRLLAGVQSSPGGAFVHVPGGRASRAGARMDGLEGFARTFMLAAFRLRGAAGRAPGDLAERYAAGLVAGTDPNGPEAWPRIDHCSQAIVEAAAIAIALGESRPWIWERLDDAQRSRVCDWLADIRGKAVWPNNWLLFPLLVETFLASVGAGAISEESLLALDRLDAFHRADGWYTDGAEHGVDHYVGWSLHLDAVSWMRMLGPRAPDARTTVLRDRLRRYLVDAAHLFARDGAPLFHGRSLLYRFAAIAALWAGALVDATPLRPGQTRRIASGALRYFVDHGAIDRGVLSMGWHREFLAMVQPYSGPASPYWCARGFVGLLLAPDHEVWRAPELPCASDGPEFVRAMPTPGFLAWADDDDGIVRVATHRGGGDQFPFGDRGGPLYTKLGYSTHTAPELGPDGSAAGVDGEITFVDGGCPAPRRRVRPIAVVDRFAASVCWPDERPGETPPWFERIETVAIACGVVELRVHHVTTFSRRAVHEGGFAVAQADPVTIEVGSDWIACRRADGLTSALVDLHGGRRPRVQPRRGTNAFGRCSAAPTLELDRTPAVETVLVTAVVLARDFDARAYVRPRIEVDGRRVRIALPDGERILVQLVATESLDERLGDRPLRGRVRFARVGPRDQHFAYVEDGCT